MACLKGKSERSLNTQVRLFGFLVSNTGSLLQASLKGLLHMHIILPSSGASLTPATGILYQLSFVLWEDLVFLN